MHWTRCIIVGINLKESNILTDNGHSMTLHSSGGNSTVPLLSPSHRKKTEINF